MKLIVDGNKFKMAFISGPRHNFLSLTIVTNRLGFDFELRDINQIKDDSIERQESIKEQILDGLKCVNKDLNKDLRISFAEYSSSDTPSDNIYKDLAINIIKEAFSHGYLE